MCESDAQFYLTTFHLINIVGARIYLQMVNIIDRESAGHSRLIVAIAVGEGGMKAHHGQVVFLQLRFLLVESLARERTFFYFLQLCSNLLAGVKNLLVVERSIEKLRSAWLHLSRSFDRFAYCK